MELNRKDKETLHLLYINEEPIMRMESMGVKMTFHFAKEPPTENIKSAVINILTNCYVKDSKKKRKV